MVKTIIKKKRDRGKDRAQFEHPIAYNSKSLTKIVSKSLSTL